MEVIIDANFGLSLGPKSGETLLEFSDSAVKKLKALQVEEQKPNLMLRVSVYGGGCSGFQYTFSLEEETKPVDRTVEKDGVTLVIDQMSYQYLTGSTVDYVEGLEGAMFVVNNPNATSTCGCGASFSI
ncbi:MAG: iron-sulfur cluster insertion protein ErpA [Gammaproteobacteria bacterium]|nr:iron-sulfur cluster insertion protein ErpA [Gammaproteobacteria bacterium]